jgi:hypothetical protein
MRFLALQSKLSKSIFLLAARLQPERYSRAEHTASAARIERQRGLRAFIKNTSTYPREISGENISRWICFELPLGFL